MNLGSSGELNAVSQSFDRSEGLTREVHFEGTEQFITALFAQIQGQAKTASMSHKGPLWKLDARLDIGQLNSANEVTLDVRMQVNAAKKSIFEPPGPAGITDDDLRYVQQLLEDKNPPLPGHTVSNEALSLYELTLRGVSERTVYQPIVAVTRTAGYNYRFPNRYADVGSNLSQAVMIQDAGIQGVFQFDFPVFTEALAPGFTYGWLKHMPFYDQAVGQRTVEYLQYEFGAWSDFLYPLVG